MSWSHVLRLEAASCLLAGAALSCGRSNGATETVTTVRDSAGITIVENDPRGAVPALSWQIGATPRVDIGGMDQGSAYELYQVRNALRLADGRVVVSNGGTRELRFYDPNGKYLGATGREGEGPGEFRALGYLYHFAGDSILAADSRLRRLSILDRNGVFRRSITVMSAGDVSYASLIDVFADGSYLMQGAVNTRGVTPSGFQRYPNPLYHFAADGAFLEHLGSHPGSDSYFEPVGNRGFRVCAALFGRNFDYRAAGNQLMIASADRYEVTLHARDGSVSRIIRLAAPPRRVTDADVERERSRRLEEVEGDDARREAERLFSTIPRPDIMPAYSRVFVDDSLNFWIREYATPWESATDWIVFDSEGKLLGATSLPDRFEPSEIGHDFVLGVWTDDLEVQHVRLYDLSKSPKESG